MDLLGAISKEFQTAKQDFEITNNSEKWKMQKNMTFCQNMLKCLQPF